LQLLARQERAGDLNEGTLKVHVTNNLERALTWTQEPSVKVARKDLRGDEFWLELSVRRSDRRNSFVVSGVDRRKQHLLFFKESGIPEPRARGESPVDEIFEVIRAAVEVQSSVPYNLDYPVF